MEEEMDIARAHRFFWLYEEWSQDRWGLFEQDRQVRLPLRDLLSRPTLSALDGEVTELSSSPDELRVSFTGGGEHLLAVPLRDGRVVRATCDGAETAATQVRLDVRVACGDGGSHVLEVRVE